MANGVVLAVGNYEMTNGFVAGEVVADVGGRLLSGRVYVTDYGGVFVEGGSIEDERLRRDDTWWDGMTQAISRAVDWAACRQLLAVA